MQNTKSGISAAFKFVLLLKEGLYIERQGLNGRFAYHQGEMKHQAGSWRYLMASKA